ncbi:hypothetical protein TWF703_003902 [Orbilia oligospora]|uniref:Uncharacterized protein n=1 Tax=Orbilia oligospora TaxID=2813651 RepID=A0A7C8P1K5_ORBOL|nr:hypothetical protein TWF703_003902 [Orbilia oligospora]
MPARDLAEDLAKAIFKRLPGKIAKSQNVELLAENYLSKEPSPGLDPEISREVRLEKVFDRYIRDLDLYLPKYLDELLDEEVKGIPVLPKGVEVEEDEEDEKQEKSENADLELAPALHETGGEFDSQAILHTTNNPGSFSSPSTPSTSPAPPGTLDSLTNPTSTGDFITSLNTTRPHNDQTTPGLTKETSEENSTPGSSGNFNQASDTGFSDSDSAFSSRPSSAGTSATSLFDPFDSIPDALPKTVEGSPNQNVQSSSTDLPLLPQTTSPVELPSTKSGADSQSVGQAPQLTSNTVPIDPINIINQNEVHTPVNSMAGPSEAKSFPGSSNPGQENEIAKNDLNQHRPEDNSINEESSSPVPLPEIGSPFDQLSRSTTNTTSTLSRPGNTQVPESTPEDYKPRGQSEILNSETTPIGGASASTSLAPELPSLQPHISGSDSANDSSDNNSQQDPTSVEAESTQPGGPRSNVVFDKKPSTDDIHPFNAKSPVLTKNGFNPPTLGSPNQSLPKEQPETILSPALPTPEMVFDKPGLCSPLSESSVEPDDDDRTLSPSSKTQISRAQTPIPVGKATGLGLLTQDSMELQTQQDPVYIVGSDQEPLFTPPYYQDAQVSSPQFLDNPPLVVPLGEERALPAAIQTSEEAGSTLNSECNKPTGGLGVKDLLNISPAKPLETPQLPSIHNITAGGTNQESLDDRPIVASVSEQAARREGEQAGVKNPIHTDALTIIPEKFNPENKYSGSGTSERNLVSELDREGEGSLSSKELRTAASPLNPSNLEPSQPKTPCQKQVKGLSALAETVLGKTLVPAKAQVEGLKSALPTAPVPKLQKFPTSDPEAETSSVTTVSPSPGVSADFDADDEIPNTKDMSPGLLGKISLSNILPDWRLKTPILPNILPQMPTVSLSWIAPVLLTLRSEPTVKKNLVTDEHTAILDGLKGNQVGLGVLQGENSDSENGTDERYKDTIFILPPTPGGFPPMEEISEEPVTELLEMITSEPDTHPDASSIETPSSNIWDQVISLLNTIILQAWIPYFEFVSYLTFSFKALNDSHTEFPIFNSLILDSWTPGLELLHYIISLPHLLPEHIVPESDHFTKPSIEFWIPVLEAVDHLLAALTRVPYHLLLSLSTYKSLASLILELSSTIGNLRYSSLPPEFVAQLTEILPSFPITSWLKLYEEAFSSLFQKTATKDSPKENSLDPLPSSSSPSCPHESFSVCTCQVVKSFSPQTNPEFNFYIGLRFNPQLLQKAGCTNIECSYSHLYLYLILLTWVTEPAYIVGSTKSLGSIISLSLPIFLPILLHFKFSLGFPLSVLHLSYSSLRLLRNVLV